MKTIKKRDFKRNGKFWVYIVECADGTYYTGYTNDLEARVKLHNSGHGAKYLKGKGPVKLVYVKEYRYYKNALHAERNLKKLTRVQKEELVGIYARNKDGSK
jgi:putative endonuclease